MRTKAIVTQSVHQCNIPKGSKGFIDGYVQADDGRGYACFVSGEVVDFVPLYALKITSDDKGKQLKLIDEPKQESGYTEEFEKFFNYYHANCKRPKTDKAATFKYFQKLKQSEKDIIRENLPKFLKANNTEFVPKARTYLSKKLWEDELSENTGDKPTIQKGR